MVERLLKMKQENFAILLHSFVEYDSVILHTTPVEHCAIGRNFLSFYTLHEMVFIIFENK